jgi:uncharacterized protein YwqG
MTSKNRLFLNFPTELQPFYSALSATIQDYLQIKITPNSTNWWQSKFGGLPYFPKNLTYPTNNKGQYLRLLAQLNFAEIPNLNNFPTQGILQFYVDNNDEIYGLDFDDPIEQKGFRVLYFYEVDNNLDNLLTTFDFLPNFEEDYYFPVRGEFSLEFNFAQATISPLDVNISQKIPQLNPLDNLSLWILYAKFYEDNFPSVKQHQLGGYPYFTQSDPRSEIFQEENDPYQLLLQIDSEYFEPNQEICWGDVGIANFFIQPSSLKNLDFSKVLYNWDCS